MTTVGVEPCLRALGLVILVVASAPSGAQEESARPARPEFEISRATSEVKVDGTLEEPAWGDALRMTLDYEWFPADNVSPPVETEVFLTYDDVDRVDARPSSDIRSMSSRLIRLLVSQASMI